MLSEIISMVSRSSNDSTDFLNGLAQDSGSADMLSPKMQVEINEMNREVNGEDSPYISTIKEMDDANRATAWKLLQQEEEARIASSLDGIISGRWTATDVNRVAVAHALDGLVVEDDRAKSALAYAYARNQQAKAAIENPELINEIDDPTMRFRNNYTVFMNKLAKLDEETSGWETAKFVLSDFIPGVSEVSKSNAYERYTGLKGEWTSPVEMMKKLSAHVSYDMFNMPTLQFDAKLEDFITKSKKDNVNLSRLRNTFEEMFDPMYNAEAFGAGADVLAVGAVAAKGVSGAIKGTGLIGRVVSAGKSATFEAVEQANPLAVVPFVGAKSSRIVNGALDATMNLAADTTSKVGKKIFYGNRKSAAEDIARMVGSPTETDAPTYLKNGVNSMAHPVESEITNVSNEAAVIEAKNSTLRTQRAIEALGDKTTLESVKQNVWEKFTDWISDTLKSEDTFQNAYGIADIVRVADLSENLRMTEKGYLAVSVRLKKAFDNYEDAESAAQSISNNAGGIKVKARASAVEMKEAKIPEEKATEVVSDIATGKIDENPAKVSQIGSKFYVDVDIEADKGWGTLWAEQVSKGKRQGFRGFLSGLFTRSSTPLHIQMLDEGRFMDVSHLTSSMESIVKKYDGLKGTDKAIFEKLVDLSLQEGAWYSPEHLAGRGVSSKVVDMYEDFKTFNDFDYYVTNKIARQRMTEQGVRDLYLGDTRIGYGRVLPKDPAQSLTALETSTRKIIIGTNAKPISFNEKLKSEWEAIMKDHVLVERIYGPDEFTEARSVYYVLPASSLVSRDLPTFVTTYVAGGRRYFDHNNAFVKQIHLKRNESNRNVIVGARTFFADRDSEGLVRKTKALENIRMALASGRTDEEVTRLISESDQLINAPFKDAQSFREWADDVELDYINKENSLEVLKDGDTLSSYERLLQDDNIDDLVGPEEMYNIVHRSHFQALTNEAKLQKRQRTGRILYDYNWDVAQTVDFEKQIRYMVNDMVYNGTMKDFTDFYADTFVKNYGHRMMSSNAANNTPRQLLINGLVKTGTDVALRSAIIAAQRNYAMIRGIPTTFDRKVAETVQLIVRGLGVKMCDELKFLSDSAKHNIRVNFESLTTTRPLSYARTFASHKFLGTFNISQSYKQAAACINVLALEPIAGMKALRNVVPLTSAMLSCDGDYLKAMETISQRFKDGSTIRTEYENLVKLGAFQHGVAGGFLEPGQTVKGWLNKLSMMPFNWGEMTNRVYAMLTAMHAKGFGDKLITSADDLLEIKAYGQRLFMNMDATGLSRAQSGEVGKTALQMLGFKMRWIEALCFDEELTKTQKARLALVMGALTGMEGLVGVKAYNWISNLFRDDEDTRNPSEEQISEFKKVWRAGLINMASDELGLGYDLSAPLSVEMADDIINLLAEPKSILTVSVPAVDTIKTGADLVARVYNFMRQSLITAPTPDDYSNMLRLMAEQGELPSSFNRALLGYFLYKDGSQFNRKGQLKKDDGTRLDAVLTALGFNSLDDKEVYKAMIQYSDKTKLYNDLKESLIPVYVKYCQNPSPVVWETIQYQLKTADLSDLEKGRLWSELNDAAFDNQVTPLYKQMWYRQLIKGGEYGNNILIKENK